jgi:putative two-component system response regulator
MVVSQHAHPTDKKTMRASPKVLVIDDHGPTRDGLRALLEQAGYTVSTASDGSDGLRVFKRDSPDLVLLDVKMPGISGVDVCAELKAHRDTCLTPVILISAVGDRDSQLAGLKAGADDFLNKPVDLEELYARVRSLLRIKRLTDDLESAEVLFLSLGRIVEARDPYTEGHCERLAQYAVALGQELNLDQSDLDALYRGAFLHDIGKIAIPDRVLLKKSRLTRTQHALMKQHPVIGDDLCRTLRSLESVSPIVRHHHERCDGRGYPDGLAGDQIPFLAQIVRVVDIFDALTTNRPYRRAVSQVKGLQMLRQEAKAGGCSESLVDCFIELHNSGRLVNHTISSARTRGGLTASSRELPNT